MLLIYLEIDGVHRSYNVQFRYIKERLNHGKRKIVRRILNVRLSFEAGEVERLQQFYCSMNEIIFMLVSF